MTEKSTKLEFAVQMTCQSCADAATKALSSLPGIQELTVDLANEQVVVVTTLPSERVQDAIESTGLKAVLRGVGLDQESHQQSLGSAAVAIVTGNSGQRGVIRLAQSIDTPCLIDGTVDGLAPGRHALAIHEFGDISCGCDSCGDIFEIGHGSSGTKYGDLGVFDASQNGRAEFRIENQQIKIWEIIGRSLVLHEVVGVKPAGQRRVACGIIARSSGLFQNTKRICACDGLTLWDERTLQQQQKKQTG